MKKQLQQRPAYPIESVDNALRLVQMLRDGGALRLSVASKELGIAPSTTHRLLSMLVYRGFAIQDDHRQYVAGPALSVGSIGAPWLHELRKHALGPMERLSQYTGETVNVVIRVGTHIRFLATVETSATLRIGDRTGTVMPALGASTGKALLATEPETYLRSLFRSSGARGSSPILTEESFLRLLHELHVVRDLGYATSWEETEPGVGAVGVAVQADTGSALAGISVATPIARLKKALEADSLAALFACRDEVQRYASSIRRN